MVSNNSESTPRSALKDEFLGPPRHSRTAQFSVVSFGVLMVVGLLIPAFSDIEVHAGITLVGTGFMIWLGFSELLTPEQRKFTVALRFAGAAVVMLGFIAQLL